MGTPTNKKSSNAWKTYVDQYGEPSVEQMLALLMPLIGRDTTAPLMAAFGRTGCQYVAYQLTNEKRYQAIKDAVNQSCRKCAACVRELRAAGLSPQGIYETALQRGYAPSKIKHTLLKKERDVLFPDEPVKRREHRSTRKRKQDAAIIRMLRNEGFEGIQFYDAALSLGCSPTNIKERSKAGESMHFPTSRQGNQVQIMSPLKMVLCDPSQVREVSQRLYDELARTLGRQPSRSECLGDVKPPEDRDFNARYRRETFKVKTVDSKHPMMALADSLEPEPEEDYSGMSLQQRLAADARKIAERDMAAAEGNQELAALVKRNKPELDRIKDLIQQEKFSPNGSATLVDLCEMYQACLVTPNADPLQRASLKKEIQQFMNERAARVRGEKAERIAELQSEINGIRDGSVFAEEQDSYDAEMQECDRQIAEADEKLRILEQQRLEGERNRQAEVTRRMEAQQHHLVKKPKQEIQHDVMQDELKQANHESA